MTVRELIQHLQALPQDLPVYYDDYEFGLRADLRVAQRPIGTNDNGALVPVDFVYDACPKTGEAVVIDTLS